MDQIYLITPEIYIEHNIVKIGKHKGNTMKKINEYGENTKIHSIKSVYDSKLIEKELIKQFKNKFKIYKGHEYFEGHIEECIELFDMIVNEINNNNNFIKRCTLNPEYYRFHCKTYCHKKCCLKDLININNDEKELFIKCVNCSLRWKKKKVFYAKNNKNIINYIYNNIDKENKINSMESEIFIKNNICYISENKIIIEGYNIHDLLSPMFIKINNEHHLPIIHYEYPMYFYTHILYGQFRLCDIYTQHGNIDKNREKDISFKNIYIKCIKETDYIILIIDDNDLNIDSFFYAGMGMSLKKKLIIVFNDKLYFPKDIKKINNKIFNYKRFLNIYQYNYIFKKEEEDILLMFPIIRDKFLTYEDYINVQKEYNKLIFSY